jgi:hypothetical protein
MAVGRFADRKCRSSKALLCYDLHKQATSEVRSAARVGCCQAVPNHCQVEGDSLKYAHCPG